MAQAAVTDAVVSSFVIQGGLPLSGRVRAAGNKNGALPILAACLLTSEPVVLHNVPRIRDVETMIALLAEVGAEVEVGARYELHGTLRGRHIFLDEASVMATENAVMAASLAPGETVIGNAACEPHIQDLCRFLVSLGAEIEGIESNVLKIRGVERLRGGEWRICPEHIEVGSFIGLAAVTGSDVTIDDVEPRDLI